MDDDPAAPLTGPSGRAPVQPGSTPGGDARPRRREAWWTWPVLVPLLWIPAIIIASLVLGLLPSPPDICGQPHGLTCQQTDAQISAIQLAACGSLALALALWLAVFLPPARRRPLYWRALLVLAADSALLCAALLVLRVGL